MSFEKNYLGNDGFVWFFGIVENRLDPLKLGRVQVRCQGPHTPDKTKIPTEDLPWQYVILPTTSPSVSGLGQNSFIVEGSFVFGFFADGIDRQHPVILGTMPTIPGGLPNPQLGFNDPRTDRDQFPKLVSSRKENRDGSGTSITSQGSGRAYPQMQGEPDTSRIARNESIAETIIQDKKINLVQNVDTQGGAKFSEPESKYEQKFPFNRVFESESGHVTEIDDTPGQERLHEYHRSGTFREVHPDGSVVNKTVNDIYNFILRNMRTHVEGSMYLTVDKGQELYINRDGGSDDLLIKVGSGGDFNIEVVKGNVDLKISDGNLTKYINGDVTETITGNYTKKVTGNSTEDIGGNSIKKVGGNYTRQVGGIASIVATLINLN